MTPPCNSLGVLCKSQGSEQEVEDELGVRQLWDASSLLREDAAHRAHVRSTTSRARHAWDTI